MNVRKLIDYSILFTALDTLMATDLPQMHIWKSLSTSLMVRAILAVINYFEISE